MPEQGTVPAMGEHRVAASLAPAWVSRRGSLALELDLWKLSGWRVPYNQAHNAADHKAGV